MLKGDMIFCSPKMNYMLVHFTVDVESRLITKMNLVGKSLSFSILTRISQQNFYCTAKYSGFSAWSNRSLYFSISKCLCRILEMVACGSCNSQIACHVNFFWAALEARPNMGHTCITHRGLLPWKRTLSAEISCTRHKWILGWVVPCELCAKCTLHSCYRLFLH
jgi:hypothetical protein